MVSDLWPVSACPDLSHGVSPSDDPVPEEPVRLVLPRLLLAVVVAAYTALAVVLAEVDCNIKNGNEGKIVL